MRKIAKKQLLKCIFEVCYLDENEIIKLSKLCAKYKINYIQTSTGFGVFDECERVISIINREVAGKCFVKVSGGIRTRDQALKYLNLGASRIGTSRVL